MTTFINIIQFFSFVSFSIMNERPENRLNEIERVISPSFCACTSERAKEEKWTGKVERQRMPDTKPSLADQSYTGPKTRCVENKERFSAWEWECGTGVHSRKHIPVYASTEVAAFSAVPGVQETLGIHYVELLTPKRLLATIYCSIRSVRRTSCYSLIEHYSIPCVFYNDTTFFRVFQFHEEILKRKIVCTYIRYF